MNKYYMVINDENFKEYEGWQEKGWILKSLSPIRENGLITVTNELERFYLEEEVLASRLAEITEEEYNAIYNCNMNEEGWGDDEEDILQSIYTKYVNK